MLWIAGLLYGVDIVDGNGEIFVSTMKLEIQINKYFLVHSIYICPCDVHQSWHQKNKFVMVKLKKENVTTIKHSGLYQMCRNKLFKDRGIFLALEMLGANGYLRSDEPEWQLVGRLADVGIKLYSFAGRNVLRLLRLLHLLHLLHNSCSLGSPPKKETSY